MWGRRVIPCLLLKDKGLYKTVKFKAPKYVGDPLNAVRIFNEKEVDELIVLDICATPENRGPNFEYLRDIASECFMPLCYGGGIASLDDMERLFRIGVEKVCLNTAAFEQPDLIENAVAHFGSQSIVVSLDVKKTLWNGYKPYIYSGQRKVGDKLINIIKKLSDSGVGEIVVNNIDREGMMTGYDLDLIKTVTEAVDIPVIAMGGAGCVDDFTAAAKVGASAMAAGSMFVFHGKHRAVLITYPDREILDRFIQVEGRGQ